MGNNHLKNTFNCTPDWSEAFGDQAIATVIIDRLLHHATTLNIKGESYRLKEKRNAGLLNKGAESKS